MGAFAVSIVAGFAWILFTAWDGAVAVSLLSWLTTLGLAALAPVLRVDVAEIDEHGWFYVRVVNGGLKASVTVTAPTLVAIGVTDSVVRPDWIKGHQSRRLEAKDFEEWFGKVNLSGSAYRESALAGQVKIDLGKVAMRATVRSAGVGAKLQKASAKVVRCDPGITLHKVVRAAAEDGYSPVDALEQGGESDDEP